MQKKKPKAINNKEPDQLKIFDINGLNKQPKTKNENAENVGSHCPRKMVVNLIRKTVVSLNGIYNSDLEKVNFANTNLYRCSFIGCKLSNTFFTNCEMMKISFAASVLWEIDFSTTSMLDNLDFRTAGFNNVYFNKSVTDSNFNGCSNASAQFRYFIEERLEEQKGQPAILNAIKYSSNDLHKCSTDALSGTDIKQVFEAYNKIKSEMIINRVHHRLQKNDAPGTEKI